MKEPKLMESVEFTVYQMQILGVKFIVREIEVLNKQ